MDARSSLSTGAPAARRPLSLVSVVAWMCTIAWLCLAAVAVWTLERRDADGDAPVAAARRAADPAAPSTAERVAQRSSASLPVTP